jgi:hypothetical protein
VVWFGSRFQFLRTDENQIEPIDIYRVKLIFFFIGQPILKKFKLAQFELIVKNIVTQQTRFINTQILSPHSHNSGWSTLPHKNDDEKEKVKSIYCLQINKWYLTTDCWTSIQNMNYMVVTSHYIDEGCVLNKKNRV